MGSTLSGLDRERLSRALQLAEQAIGVSDPNPRVGCVIADARGNVVGEGSTQQAGGPHAEVVALARARAAGAELQGGTAWVSLEPCAHHGRTPPCCDALVQAGLHRVVAAMSDPFPAVNGRGFDRLRAAGIQVDLADGELTEAARELNVGFLSRIERGRPWIRAKAAISLDGRTALGNGVSQWITGPEAREDGHRWRRRAAAILTGSGTVRADDPRLDVRVGTPIRQPLRVVLDTSARLSPAARILAPPGRTLVFVGPQADPAPLRDAGAEVVVASCGPQGIELPEVIRELARRDINEVHVEAGPVLTGALATGGWIDEWLVYVAPLLLGPGAPPAALPALTSLEGIERMRFVEAVPVGADLRLRLRPRRRAESPDRPPESRES